MKGKNEYVINKGTPQEVKIKYNYELTYDAVKGRYHFKVVLLNYTKETIDIFSDDYSYIINSRNLPEALKHQTFRVHIKRFLLQLVNKRN
ncbi:hypothetical protein ACFX5U_14620 [Sphingobacterium sp. SG20118]|uniref:hypothetical protein n=1 Tax=unclassified Sphingobacterium TaxID=2609468 RepID=UPI0004F89598|nr:hypothetical protein [Sphingobacterium sp. ML3W]AIM37972.1 hypothetical protein KO02_15705 [Sphingobacterium sp. ML3W]